MDYFNVLEEGQDLVEAAASARAAHFRETEVQAVIDALARNRPVLLMGPAGVGKSAVLSEVARRLGEVAQGDGLRQFGLRRFTTAQILTGTRYLGEWQTKLTQLMNDAENRNAVLNIVDVWNLPTVGTSATNRENLLDAMRTRLTDGRLRLISEATAEQFQEMHRIPKFASLFEVVRIEPLSDTQLREVVEREAATLDLAIDQEARERLFQLCQNFTAFNFGPGPALDLLQKVRDYRDQKLAIGEAADVTPLFVEKVFAIHSGLPLFVVSRTESKSAAEIRDWFRARIIGQDAAIDAVVEMMAFYKARLHDKSKPIGTFLFVGPTGVGKTELARALAEFFFGSERRMLRFDMSEFSDYNSFEMLIGSPHAAVERPARLIDPVRSQPFQVLLFDELEKAHRNVQDLFLQLLDEGRLTTPRGETLSFRNTIIVATSNVGALEGLSPAIGFGDQGPSYDLDKALRAIEGHFRPEFINRFQHVVLFHPLTREQAARIARIDLQAILKRDGIVGQNLIVDVHDDVIDHVLSVGFNPRYGGRGIKREIRRQVILPLATVLMERTLEPGTLIEVGLDEGRVRVRVTDTPESKRSAAEKAPVRTEKGERLTREAIKERLAAARAACEQLAPGPALSRLQSEIERVDEQRKDYTFWHDPDEAAHVLAEQSRWLEAVSRIERLRVWVGDLDGALAGRTTRSDLAQVANGLVRLEAALAITQRELVTMGPDGYWDALLEIAPVGGNSDARNFMFELYRNWASYRRLDIVMLCEPMAAEEAIAIAIRGHFAHGYLAYEAGHHRVRQRESAIARVRVAPLSTRAGAVEFGEERALKASGQLGGRIRSRVAILGSRLILQNARTLSENRELARDVAPSWPREQSATPANVRRYDLNPFLVRDHLTKADFTRKDVLGPKGFHELLCTRIDRAVQGDGEAAEN